MAKNPPVGDGHRHGQVTSRSQTLILIMNIPLNEIKKPESF
jgi:hypothetical protein